MIDPAFAARSYSPGRIALLPPDVFAIYDRAGENDPELSAALGNAATLQTVELVSRTLRSRGYDVDLSAGRDGVRAGDGTVLVSGEELGWLANSVLRFATSPAGGAQGQAQAPAFVAPELCARVGGATGSDAILYVNIKGVAQSPGKRTAQAVAGVLFVAVIVAVVVLLILEAQGGRTGGAPLAAGGAPGGPPATVRAAPGPPTGAAAVAGGAAPTTAVAVPRGHGHLPSTGGGRVYGGPHVSVGVGVVVPLHGPAHTHEGAVREEDDLFGGDHVYVSLTLLSAHDGRVLWHLRDELDVELDNPRDLERFVSRTFDTLPPSLRPPR